MSTSSETLIVRGENLRTAYEQLCLSYRAIDDFRSKLLSLLPFVTGAGVLALLGPLAPESASQAPLAPESASQAPLAPIGLFGFLVTFGLFLFEIHSIQKCRSLINSGVRLECELKVANEGQFCRRQIGVVSMPLAAGLIYPTVGAAWLYLASNLAWWWPPILCMLIGFLTMLIFNHIWLPIVEPPPVECRESLPKINRVTGRQLKCQLMSLFRKTSENTSK
jgi:hypothetical protein